MTGYHRHDLPHAYHDRRTRHQAALDARTAQRVRLKATLGSWALDIDVMFRAWHDWCHIMGGHDFSLEGERQAALMQCEHIKRRYGDGDTGQELCRLVMIEVLGQAQYAEAHGGAFPVDQMQFTKAYLAPGATALTASF